MIKLKRGDKVILYHGTSIINSKLILEQGFKPSYGRFGMGVYFTDNLTIASYNGEVILQADTPIKSIIFMDYETLREKYSYINISDQQGIPQLQYDLKCEAVGIIYKEGDTEVCVYDESIIKDIRII